MDSFEVNFDANDNESIDVDLHGNVIHEDEPIESKMSKKRARNYSSHMWNYFKKPVMHSDGKVMSKCKYCLKDYVGGDNKNGTSTLQRRMGKCDVYLKTRSNSDVGNIILDHAGRLRNMKIDQSVVYV